MTRALYLGVLATGLLATVVSAPAQAADNWPEWDRQTMSGAQCQPSTGSQWPDFLVYPSGIRNNSATSNRYISCTIPFNSESPINQADTSATTPAGRMRVIVTLDYSQVSASSNWTTNCTLFGQSNETVQSDTQSRTSVRTTALRTIDFGYSAALNGVDMGWHDATVSLNCRLPPKVKLVAVKTYEYGATGNYRWVP